MVSAFVLGGVSLDPSEEFIVARTAGNTWLTLAIYNSLRCFISSSLRVIFFSSYSFFHSSLPELLPCTPLTWHAALCGPFCSSLKFQ